MDMEIRDNRQKEWFWLDNEYLNGYAKYLGASCTVVYLSLCRHADNYTQQCFPSMKLIAEENGISTRTVVRSISILEEWGIIKVMKSKKDNGTQANNIYTLTSKKQWKPKPSDIKSHGSRVTKSEEPSDKNDKNRVTLGTYNNTHINNTHINNTSKTGTNPVGIQLIIEMFSVLNPACKKMYGNTTQRQASQDLIDTYGIDEVTNCIKNVLPITNQQQYFPTVTTPAQLRDKWVSLKSAVLKRKSKQKEIV
jgi:hypothetical protein